ncbi:MAG TPA: hypothetical protein EYG93_11480 [Sulfurospirillum arcachonense]|nr:hypothetical protein [Sulfurospirillum arcachonense]
MKKSRLFLSILFYLFFISSKIYANVIVDYRFDECIWDGTTNEVKDSSGNSNHATLYNLETTKNEKVLVRSGDFTANSNSDYIDLKPTILDGEGDFTISTWIKSSASQDQTILSGANSSQQNELIMFFRNGGTTFHPYIKGSTQTINIADVTDGTWHHLVWRRDSSTGQNCITVDRNTTSCANGTTGNLNIEGLVLGQEQDSVGGGFVSNQDFEGYMDEFKIYGTRLSDSEVQDIYDNEVSGKNYDGTVREETCIEPIVDYHLDDLCNSGGSSFRVAESTDLNLTGVISPDGNSLVSKQGKVCTGAEFNGVDEYISVDDNDVFDNTQTLTTVAWIYPTELAQTNGTNARGIFSKRNSYSGNSQYAYGVFFWNGNNLSSTEASIYVDIDSQNNRTHSIKKIKVNEWTHIAIVFDGRLPQNERTKIYINGILDSVHSESSSSIPDYSSDFHIGNLYSGESEIKVFKGVMDEVKIYNKALSSTYIATLYSRENSGLDYSGTFRNCICSIMDRNATFNAVDSLGGCFNWNC